MYVSGLADIHYGDWQGLTPEEVRVRWPAELAAWYNAPETAYIPGGDFTLVSLNDTCHPGELGV
jgi:broad specificity phosphatase PhoE